MASYVCVRSLKRIAGRSLAVICRRPAALLLAAALVPATAGGQSRFHFRGIVEVAQRYDDNLFSTPLDRKGDFVTRVSPRLSAGYRAGNFSVLARYSRDLEAFSRQHELNSARAAQEAIFEVRWPLGHVLSAASSMSYADSKTAHDLDLITGLETGRFPARHYSARQSLALRIGARRRLVADATFDRWRSTVGPPMEMQGATLGFEQRVGPSDKWGLDFSLRRFVGGGSIRNSHIVALAWSRDVTPLAHFEIKAGPRLSDGQRVSPELSVSLVHRLTRGDFTVAYLRTESTVIGLSGPVTAEGVTGRFTHDLSRSVQIRGGPSVLTSRQAGMEGMVYRFNSEMAWRLGRRLVLTGSHMVSLQEGDLGAVRRGDILHNTFTLLLSAPPADR